MLGILYLAAAVLLGIEITALVLAETENKGKINIMWVFVPASFGTGTLLLTWLVYLLSWTVSVMLGGEKPLFWGNLIALCIVFLWIAVLYILRLYHHKSCFPWKKKNSFVLLSDRKRFRGEWIFFLCLCIFVTYMMFYVFQEKNGILYSGFSVFGDYAPHTAMMRSFSRGNNFPTQYPHFGGADVKYHFMFQFLSGNLEYLGLRLDWAYNLVSVFSLVGFLMILYSLALRFGGSMLGGILAIMFFVFRSGTAVFQFCAEHLKAGDLWQTLQENTSFIGYTANENWGLWNFNVYLNQRHLGFGLLLAALAIWVFADWVEAGASHEGNKAIWIRKQILSVEAWKVRRPDTALLMGLILGLSAFWNGAAVIGGLLILCGMAILSDGKGDYLILAVVTVVLSWLQTQVFIRGSTIHPAFYFGFLAEDKTLAGVLIYLFKISGFFFLGILLLLFILKRKEKIMMMAFLFPTLFAFFVSLTPDINVNHKYVMISYAFLTIFWGDAVSRLLSRKWSGKIAAVLLSVCLMATGIYDFVIILRDNDANHRVSVKMESSLTDWLTENLRKNDLILTPEYSMNEVTMSGAMLYLGWPYYAWSAGYNTYYRADRAIQIYTTEDKEFLKELVRDEHITYILYENGMEFESQECREDTIRSVYPLVYTSEDGRIRIYGTEE